MIFLKIFLLKASNLGCIYKNINIYKDFRTPSLNLIFAKLYKDI